MENGTVVIESLHPFMTALIGLVERLLVVGSPPAFAGRFFRMGLLMTALGYFNNYPARVIAAGVLLAAGVSLLALALRYIEDRLARKP